MRIFWVFGLLMIVCSANLSCVKVPEPKINADDIRKMIDQLVSQNQMPITGDEDESLRQSPKFPEGFDRTKQEKVYDARYKLNQLGPTAFPYLIERWNDKRYSITVSSISGYCHNNCVGNVCRDVIYDQLQPYGIWARTEDDPRTKPQRPRYPSEFLNEAKDAIKWYEQHKSKTLYEMQLMIINWVIDQESKRPGDFTDEERLELQEIRADLIKTCKPIEQGNYFGNDTEA